MFKVQILTIHPEVFPGVLGVGVVGNALSAGLWQLQIIDIRDFATNKHQTVDDTPYGGGAGMVMQADVISLALDYALSQSTNKQEALIIYTTPRGHQFTQAKAQQISNHRDLIIVCGRYEDIDQRVIEHYGMQEISLGDFVLSGGEVAAQTMLEASVRLMPGVLGNSDSLQHESFNNHLLECPQYTRPQVWKERAVPDILLSGHHHQIEQWRRKYSKNLTRDRRSDLWLKYLANIHS